MENADESPAFVLAVGAMVDQCYQCDLEHSLEAFRQLNFNYSEGSKEKSATNQLANEPAAKTTLLDEALDDDDDESQGSEETEQDTLEGAEITVKDNAKFKLECPVSPLSGVKTLISAPTLDLDVFDERDEEALEGIDDDYMDAKTPRGFTPTLADVDYIYRVVFGFTSHFDPKVEASNTEADDDSALTELLSIRSKSELEDGDESTAKSQTSRAVYTSGNIKRILEEFRKEANKNEVEPIMEELPMETRKPIKNPWARLSTAISKMKKRNLDHDAEIDSRPIHAASKAFVNKKETVRKPNGKSNQEVSKANGSKRVVAGKPDSKHIQAVSKVNVTKKTIASKQQGTPIQEVSKEVVVKKENVDKPPANESAQEASKVAKEETTSKPDDELIQGVTKAIAAMKEAADKKESSPVECRDVDDAGDAASIDTKELNDLFEDEEQAPVRDEAPEEEGHEVVAPATEGGVTKRRNRLANYIRRLRGKNAMQVVVQDLPQSDISKQQTPLASSQSVDAKSVQSQRVEEVPSNFGVERILDDLPKLTYTLENDTVEPASVVETIEALEEEDAEVPDRYTPRNAQPEPVMSVEPVKTVEFEEPVQSISSVEPAESVQLNEQPMEEQPVPEDQEFFASTLDTVTASTVDEEDFTPKRKNAIVNYVKRLRGKDKHALKEVVEDFERNERKYLKKIAGKFKNFQFDSEQRLRKILAKLRKAQLKRLSIVIATYIEKQTAVPIYSPRHGVNTDWQAAPWNKPILALTAE
eukprot:Nitzschia sp. Nitz4//scaffold152_size53828//47579//49852//NITZ4_006753-RA/size53828-processed-gene-0.76-mRNA-1//1//CDS//3329537235//1899//frame0